MNVSFYAFVNIFIFFSLKRCQFDDFFHNFQSSSIDRAAQVFISITIFPYTIIVSHAKKRLRRNILQIWLQAQGPVRYFRLSLRTNKL